MQRSGQADQEALLCDKKDAERKALIAAQNEKAYAMHDFFGMPQGQRYCCGCTRLWYGDFQDNTFVLSLAVQLAIIIFSIVAFIYQAARTDELDRESAEVLNIILVLETVVQLIEFAWYAYIACTYYYQCESWGIEWRYLDWFLSTPTMLITLFFFVRYLADDKGECVTSKQLREADGFGWWIVLIVLADWAMLLCGIAYEVSPKPEEGDKWWTDFCRWVARTTHGYRHGVCPILVGFLFLVAAFVPHFRYAIDYPSAEGTLLVIVTFVVWALYGMVALIYGDPRAADGTRVVSEEAPLSQARNGCYNLLDLVAKNAMGVLVAIVAWTRIDGPDPCPVAAFANATA